MPVSKVYKHTDTYDRKCKICDKNEIRDKFYFKFICLVFPEDRIRLLKEYYRKFPSMYKFIELMSTTNMKDLRKLVKFATIIIRKLQQYSLPCNTCSHFLYIPLYVTCCTVYIFTSAIPKKRQFENKYSFIHLFKFSFIHSLSSYYYVTYNLYLGELVCTLQLFFYMNTIITV